MSKKSREERPKSKEAAKEPQKSKKEESKSTHHFPPATTTVKWSPPIVKYVTVKWDDWQYLKEGAKAVELEVAQVSSRPPGPESVTLEEVHRLREQFDVMLARIAPTRPAVAQTAAATIPATQPTPQSTEARPTPPLSQPSSGKDSSSKSNTTADQSKRADRGNKKTPEEKRKQSKPSESGS